MALDAVREPDGFADATNPMTEILPFRYDPRFATKADLTKVADHLDGGGTGIVGGVNLAPKNTGGYDLSSPGRSWIDPRDDVTSWGD